MTTTDDSSVVRLRCCQPGCRFRTVTEWARYSEAAVEFVEHWKREHQED